MADLNLRKDAALTAIAAAASSEALEQQRLDALGKKGWVSLALKTLGGMTPDERKQAAPAIQKVRADIDTAIEAKKAEIETAELEQRLANETIDLTLPAPELPAGSVHPVSQVMDELAEIFADLGFAMATGPEIEDDWHNFTALNMDEHHPARAMHDTFYFPDAAPAPDNAQPSGAAKLPERMLLRTHTSPVQIRALKEHGAPIRIIAPGRVYRSDSDATHTPMFHQVEGLAIDRDIHLGHLKWTLETVFRAFFEREDITLRLRPSYFPFTEPSVEVDVGYSNQGNRRVVGGHGDDDGHDWMELGGSGMVNARVLEMAGLDPDEWQGFAFGLGIDRLAMLKYGMNDLRSFFDGDPRWLAHYGFSAFDQPTLSAGVGARP